MSNTKKFGTKFSLTLTMIALTLGILMLAANSSFADMTVSQLSAYNSGKHYSAPAASYPSYVADSGAIKAGTDNAPILKLVLTDTTGVALEEVTLSYTGTDPADVGQFAVYDDNNNQRLSTGSLTARKVTLFLPTTPSGTFVIAMDVLSGAGSNIVDAKIEAVNGVDIVDMGDADTDGNPDLTGIGNIIDPNPGNPTANSENFARIDKTSPTFHAAEYNRGTKVLKVEFDDGNYGGDWPNSLVRITHVSNGDTVSDIDLSKFYLERSDGAYSINLAGATLLKSDNPADMITFGSGGSGQIQNNTVYIRLTINQDAHFQHTLANNARLRIGAGALRDYQFGNAIADTGRQAMTYIADTTAPTLAGMLKDIRYNYNTYKLTARFSEAIPRADVDLANWTISNATGDSLTLVGATVMAQVSPTVAITVTHGVADTLDQNEVLKGDPATLTLADAAVKDVSGNYFVAAPTKDVYVTPPLLNESAAVTLYKTVKSGTGSSQVDVGYIDLQFSEELKRSNTDATKVKLLYYKASDNTYDLFALSQGELMGIDKQPGDERIVGFQLTSGHKEILAKHAGTLRVTVEAGTVKDVYDNLNAKQEKLALASNDLPPELLVTTYNHDTKELFLQFDEKIRVVYDPDTAADGDTNQPRSEKVKIMTTDGTSGFYLNQDERAGGQPTETSTFTFILSTAHRDEIASWGITNPADLFVRLDADAFKDLANNGNAAMTLASSDYTTDTIPPVVTMVEYIPVGPDPGNPIRQMIITLNESMKSATGTGSADLSKMYVLKAPGASQKQLSAGGTTEFDGNDVIINDVTTDDDSADGDDTPHEVLVNGADPQLRLEAGAIEDLAGNNVSAGYHSVTIDTTPPDLQSASYEHISMVDSALVQDGRLTLNFDEDIDTGSIELEKIILNNTFALKDADGTYATVETYGEASTIVIKITNDSKVTTISSWGVSGDTFAVKLEAGAVRNTSGLASPTNAELASFTTKDTRVLLFDVSSSAYHHGVDDDPDTSGVQLVHKLKLAFDEYIDTANIDASKIWLWRDGSGYGGPSIQLTAAEIKVISPSKIIEFHLTDEHAKTLTRWGAPSGYGDGKNTIWIELREGAVTDRAGNPNVAIGTGAVVRQSLDIWRKDTDAGDQDAPANATSASYDANNKKLAVTFDELMDVKPANHVDATKFKIWNHNKDASVTLYGYPTENNETNTMEITLRYDSHAAVNNLTAPLYLGITNSNAAHKISGEGCNTLDADSAKSITLTPDDQAPSLVCDPDNTVKSNYADGVLTLTFDENLDKPTTLTDTEADVFANNFTLLPAPGETGFSLTGAEIKRVKPGDMVVDFGDAHEFKFHLTDAHKNAVYGWTNLYVTIAAGAVKDTNDNSIATVAATKIAALPNPAPVIKIDPVIDSAPAGTDFTITASVTDNREVAEVRLYYKVGGGLTTFLESASADTQFLTMAETQADSDDYSTTIPAPDVNNKGLSYYILAKDSQGATTTSMKYKDDSTWIEGANRDNPQNVTVTGATVTLPTGTIPEFTMTVPGKYRMISVPVDQNINSIDLFAPFGTGGEGWLAWAYTGAAQYNGYQAGHIDGGVTLNPGEACWIGTVNPDNALSVTGDTADVDTPYTIILHQGWNQIGNPFNFSRSWDKDTIPNWQNDDIKDEIYWFSGESSSYSFASLELNLPNQTVFAESWTGTGIPSNDQVWKGWPGTLDPWGGYWIYSHVEGAELAIDPTTPTKGVLPPTPGAPHPVFSSWSVKFMAESAGSVDATKFAGVITDTVDDIDQYDVMDLPLLPNSNVRLSFVTEEGSYMQDMKAPADEMSWKLKATSAAETLVKVKFDADAVPSEYRTVLLIDTETEDRINLRSVSSYAYKSIDKIREFKLIVSKAHPEVYAAIPDKSKLLQNYPNPFNPETWIPFKLSKAADVDIRIYNLTGKLIRRIELGYKEAGSYTARERAAYWDGRNSYGERVASGVYFYNIQSGSFITTRRMVVVK